MSREETEKLMMISIKLTVVIHGENCRVAKNNTFQLFSNIL